MEPTKRIAVNALAQYLRTALCMVLALYSTRLVLRLLGETDFGIYALIGNVVMLVSFITSSLSISTQRFLSYSWGQGGVGEVRSIFVNAMWLHVLISAVLVAVLLAVEYPVVHSWLRIDASRREAADFVYYMMLVILALTFVTAPVKALFIARENIVFASVVDVVDAVVKLVGVIGLSWVTADSLKSYALLMASISLLAFVIYVAYALVHYEECGIPRFSELSPTILRRMLGFATWNVYAVGSTVVRSQGLAVIFNRFLGIVVNAAYGIALQVSMALSAIAASVINAMNPQLMKAEGRGDRAAMLRYATRESKYSFLVLATLLIPVLMELPAVLDFWLDDYPAEAVEFCAFIMMIVMLDQSTIGLTSANQAVGRIRNYSLLISTVRLLILPAAWWCLYRGESAHMVMIVYLCVEIVCGCIRIPFLKYTAGLDVRHYLQDVFVRSAVPVAGNVLVCWGMLHLADCTWRFVVTEVAGVTVSVILIYAFTLTADERQWVKNVVLSKIKRRK